jgi:hypothetical protein
MAISFVGSTIISVSNGANATVLFTGASGLLDAAGAQATLQQGDLVVVAAGISSASDITINTSSSGWTKLAELYSDGTTEDANLAVFYKIMGSSPDTTFVITGTGDASSGTVGNAFAFRGVDATTPMDVTATTATGTGTSVYDAPSITPSTAGAWICVIGGGALTTATAYSVPADLSSTTNHFRNVQRAETWDMQVGFGIKTDWASGAFDPGVVSGGAVDASGAWAAVTLALRPQGATNHATTGALTGQIGSISGSASSATARPSSGALTGQIGSVAGTAAHVAKHATTGALVGQIGSVAGTASSATARASSGALVGPGSVVAGSAVHNVPHASSGALAGQGSAVAGAASRAVAHNASGAIDGPGSEITGSATSFTIHAATGDLEALGALMAATAVHIAIHNATGAIVGPGAMTEGVVDTQSARGKMLRARRRRRKSVDYGMIRGV